MFDVVPQQTRRWCGTGEALTRSSHSTGHIAANLMQNISKTIQFGNVPSLAAASEQTARIVPIEWVVSE
jgi:hypothetical protein